MRVGIRRHSVSHLAVFSVSMPISSARTSAAAAEGASPSTDPGPCSLSHAARSPAMVGGLPGAGRPDEHVEPAAGGGDPLDGEGLVVGELYVPAGQGSVSDGCDGGRR